jgi:hypothetical protein
MTMAAIFHSLTPAKLSSCWSLSYLANLVTSIFLPRPPRRIVARMAMAGFDDGWRVPPRRWREARRSMFDVVTYYGVFVTRKSHRPSLTFKAGLLRMRSVVKVRSIEIFLRVLV